MEDLKKLRALIDELDEKIVELLEKRAEISKLIGEKKEKLGINIYQPEREKIVIKNVQEKSLLLRTNIITIWKEIISACKEVQGQTIKVSYLGPEGTHAHKAALTFFPKSGTELIEAYTIVDIFKEIETEKVDYGIIPIENSLQGTVRETVDLLIEKNLKIYSEFEIRIIQNLIGFEDTQINKINAVYSHPQAISQTRIWLRSNIPNAEIIKTNSTAQAVKKIVNLDDNRNVAIGSEIAANLNNLEIVARGIEDNSSNYTRFLVISKKESKESADIYKTSIVFVTKHTPGALYNVLRIFAEENINLLKIESRPRRQGLWEYIFLMDFEGHKNDKVIKSVLNKMKDITVWYKILGSFVPKSFENK